MFLIPTAGFAPIISFSFVLRTSVGWRGVFYLLTALNVVTTLCWVFFYHPPNFQMKHGKGRMWQYIKDFDYLGAFFLILGMLLFLMGISWGGTVHPWKSASVICTIVIGFVLLVVFVLYEVYMPLKEPLVPMALFKNRTWNICIILWALGASVYYANAILWPTMVFTLYADGHGDLWPGWAACLSGSAVVFGELLVPLGALFPKKNIQIGITFAAGSIFIASKSFSSTSCQREAHSLHSSNCNL
jgi:hypothetical protein